MENLKTKSGKNLSFEILGGINAVEGAVECLRSVYVSKDKYFNPKAFDPEWLKNEINAGRMHLFTIMLDDGMSIATCAAKKNTPFDDSLELGMLAVNPAYGRFGFGSKIFKHTFDECLRREYSLYYAYVVMHHSVSGKMLESFGFEPVGVIFADCNIKKNLVPCAVSQKQSHSVYVKNEKNIGHASIYIPTHIKPFAQEVYESLGVSCVVNCDELPLFSGDSVLECEQNEKHKTLDIYLWKCGDNLRQSINSLEGDCSGELQTYNIFLNVKDPSAILGLRQLTELGYRFSGMIPLCGNHEFVIMTKTNNVLIDYNELKMSNKLQQLFERIISI